MTKESKVHHPSEELSIAGLRKLKEQSKRIETEKGIKTAEELLKDFRGVVEKVLRNISLNAEQEVKILPQCLQTAVKNCILAARKIEPISSDPKTDKKFEEWVKRVQEEGFGIW